MMNMTISEIFAKLAELETAYEDLQQKVEEADMLAEAAFDAHDIGAATEDDVNAAEAVYRELNNALADIYDEAWDILNGAYDSFREYFHIWNSEEWVERALDEHGMHFVRRVGV